MRVCVRVPASSANLGPGFDCLALALDLHNQFSLALTEGGLHISVQGEGSGRLPANASNLVALAAERLFAHLGRRPAGLDIAIVNQVPVGGGLGSSATAVLGGLMGANALLGGPLSSAELLALAVELEGHPDNVAAALHGGLTLAVLEAAGPLVESIPVPAMRVAVVVPDFELPTAGSRAALPAEAPVADAVFNLGRLGLLLRAFQAGDYALLAAGMQDRLHQPRRVLLVPGLEAALAAGRQAGAAATAISGAGPAAIAFGPNERLPAAAEAMAAAFEAAGVGCRHWLLRVAHQGAKLRLC
ncbi:MAG: homoserine kinase [Candidatus Promineifilaceae bacterium]